MYWLAYFLLNISFANQNICSLPQADRTTVIECSQKFKLHQCDKLFENGLDESLLNMCSIEELKKSKIQSEFDVVSGCAEGIKNAAVSLYHFSKKVAMWPFDWDDQLFDCSIRYGHRYNELRNRFLLSYQQGRITREQVDEYTMDSYGPILRGCAIQKKLGRGEVASRVAGAIPSREQLRDMMDEVFRSAHCLNEKGRAEALCPAVAEIFAGVTAGPMFTAVTRGATALKYGGKLSRLAKKSQDRLAEIQALAKKQAEIASAGHQKDLVDFTQNPRVMSRLDKIGIDIDQLQMGMLDSDIGKHEIAKNQFLLTNTPASNELFDTLKGTANTPASRAMREVLDESGFKGKNMLNPNLSNEELREAFNKVPALQGYMHEIPGMNWAIRDLNSGKITLSEFKKRMKANLFHNGPDEGFWGFLSRQAIPGALANQNAPARAKDFFQGTVFEGDRNSNGVVTPKYPAPVSAEGLVHALADRMSQGTRGGMDKIYKELAGKPLNDRFEEFGDYNIPLKNVGFGPKGLGLVDEMLFGNPNKTLMQLEALKKSTLSNSSLTSAQRSEISRMLEQGIERLNQQQAFLSRSVKIDKNPDGSLSKITINYIDEKGQRRSEVLRDDQSAGDALNFMDRIMKAEERLNGDPLRSFPPGTHSSARRVAEVAGYASLVCGVQSLTPGSSSSDKR